MFEILDSFSLSDQNMREENQDLCSILTHIRAPGSRSNISILEAMDGVSNNNGRMASRCGAAAMLPILAELLGQADQLLELSPPNQEQMILDKLKQAIIGADTAIRQQHSGSGTTVNLAVVFGNRIFAANIGDSCTYIFRPGPTAAASSLEPLFRCMNLAGEHVRRGNLTKEQALHDPSRNQLMTMVGGDASSFYLDPAQIHTQSAPLSSGCSLVMGSDGALAVFSEEHMKQLFFDYRNQPLSQMADELFIEVQDSGADDNFTLVCQTLEVF